MRKKVLAVVTDAQKFRSFSDASQSSLRLKKRLKKGERERERETLHWEIGKVDFFFCCSLKKSQQNISLYFCPSFADNLLQIPVEQGTGSVGASLQRFYFLNTLSSFGSCFRRCDYFFFPPPFSFKSYFYSFFTPPPFFSIF